MSAMILLSVLLISNFLLSHTEATQGKKLNATEHGHMLLTLLDMGGRLQETPL